MIDARRQPRALALEQGRPFARHPGRGFTLVELLVAVSMIALLTAILLPALGQARTQAKAVVCRSNIRQLHLANTNYALENNDRFVPGAADMTAGFGGRRRWHGLRISNGVDPDPARNTFDPTQGPLAASLPDGKIKACPQRTTFVTDGAQNAFEAGCGGYGYNLAGIGSQFYRSAWSPAELAAGRHYAAGWWTSRVRTPADTVMFTDTAFRQMHTQFGDYLIEYSFCEPPWVVTATPRGPRESHGQPAEWYLTSPSIHFRHRARANVAWCDGHVAPERLEHTKADSRKWSLGWFGELSNAAFAPH